MGYTPQNPNGQTNSNNSSPVALANEQVQDGFITGQAGQSVLGNNILLTTAGTGWIDTLTTNRVSYRSFYCQVIGSAGISAGQIIFECTNDITTAPIALTWFDDSLVTGATINTFTTISASTNRWFSGKITYRFIRCRISTAFVGGTIQAITKLSATDYLPIVNRVSQATGQTFATSIATLPALAGGTNSIGGVTLRGDTAQGASTYSNAISNATNSLTQLKAGATTINTIHASNVGSTGRWLKIFNALGASVVMGTTNANLNYYIPAGQSISINCGTFGIRLPTGFTIAITAGIANNDNTATGTANEVVVSTTYF